ncbi:unnamed protein product, partial [Brassica rapa]
MDGREEQTMVEVQRTWSDCDKIEYDGDESFLKIIETNNKIISWRIKNKEKSLQKSSSQ